MGDYWLHLQGLKYLGYDEYTVVCILLPDVTIEGWTVGQAPEK